MAGPALINVLVLLLLAVTGLALPRLQAPTLPFGVRIPPEQITAPIVATSIRAYTVRLAATGAAILVLTVAAELAVDSIAIGLAAEGLMLLATLGHYLVARRSIRRVKAREQWYAGVRQGVVADTSLRTDPEPFPWLWTLPMVIVIAATAAIGIALYPSMPAVIATHYRHGVANGFQRKSPVAVATPILIQAVVSGLVVLIVAVAFRSRAMLDPAAPSRSSWQYRAFLRQLSRALLAMMVCVNLSMLLVFSQIWRGAAPGPWLTLASVALVVFGVLGVLAVSLRTGQGGRRLPVPAGVAPGERTDLAERDDDRFWRAGGLFYVNKDDPATLVPKRIGVGWTVNLGSPWGPVVLAAPIVLILAIALLTGTTR